MTPYEAVRFLLHDSQIDFVSYARNVVGRDPDEHAKNVKQALRVLVRWAPDLGIPTTVDDLVSRSYYTVRNGHAWTSADHDALINVVSGLLREVQQSRPIPRPSFSSRVLSRIWRRR